MSRICQSCKARIDDGMKICPNCGRLVPKPRASAPVQQRQNEYAGINTYQQAPKRVYEHPNRPKTNVNPQLANRPKQRAVPVQNPAQKRVKKPRPQTVEQVVYKEPKSKSGKLKIVFKLIKVAVAVALVYLIMFGVQIFRIRLSTYDFSIKMAMTQKNYGQAIDNYFESGSWSYNPFTFTATYSGERANDDEVSIKFKAGFSVHVQSIEKDGEEVKKSFFETELMAMFI